MCEKLWELAGVSESMARFLTVFKSVGEGRQCRQDIGTKGEPGADSSTAAPLADQTTSTPAAMDTQAETITWFYAT